MIRLLFYIVLALVFSSCGINSNLMFKSKDHEVIRENIPIAPMESYRMASDDKFIFTLYANEGKRIIDVMSGISEDNATTQLRTANTIHYWVQPNGVAELPIIGSVQLAGLTVKEAQDKLASLFSKHYNDPYVQIEITNQRVIVFPGSGGDAKIIPLTNNNTTLMEALAAAGGITDRGRAKRIKIMRVIDSKRIVYEVDLSTIEGLRYTDMIVQANDYIYVEPTRQLSQEFFKEIAPILSVLTSAAILITVIARI